LKKVKLQDVQRVADSYLRPSNRTVAMFLPADKPDRTEIPAAPDLAALVRDYKGGVEVAAGEAVDSSTPNVAARTRKFDLTSGLKLALLPKKTRGGTVLLRLSLRFGDETSLMNRSAAASLAGQMLMRGTARHTRQQIQDEFDKLKARVFVSGGVSGASAGIETIRDNLPAALALVAEILREPSFPASEFDQLKQEQI